MLVKDCMTFALFLFIVSVSYANGKYDTREPDFSKYESSTTKTYDYVALPIDLIKNQSDIYLKFDVKAERDAHVVFSPTASPAKKSQKAYEIVLGAENNKYSTIRSSRAGTEEKRIDESDILSPKEWRQFWIRISSNGLIEVGKGGSLAFMSWKDEHHTTINHFGFASWEDGNTVNWRFQVIENSTLMNNITNENNLVQNLLSKYNKSTPPQNRTLLDEVNITITNQYAYVKNDSLEMVGIANIVWKDSRLKWNSSLYNNSRNLDVEYDSIWKPKLNIKNDLLSRNKSLDTGYVILSHEGIVSWTTLLHIKIPCLSMENLKMMSQVTCPIKTTYVASKVNIEVQNNNLIPSPSPYHLCSGVEVSKNDPSEFIALVTYRRRGQ